MKPVGQTPGTLLLPYNPLDDRTARGEGAVILGAQQFVRSFYRALIEHGTLPSYRFFCSTSLVAPAIEQLRAFAGRRRAGLGCLDVRPQARLASATERDDILGYFEPNLSVDVMFRVRQAFARRPFPITLLHHSFSYRPLLHSTFLRLLLEDTRAYDSLICSSQSARRALGEILQHVRERFAAQHGVELAFRGRLDVIPLGVDVDLWRPRDQAAARAEVGLPQSATILLYLGRLSATDKADLEPLLSVFARLSRRQSRGASGELLLVLAGSGRAGDVEGLRAQIEQRQLSRRVRVMLEPSAPQVLMSAADVFVSPADSVQEAFGLTPLEAMAAGVPQVVADWDGYRETVIDGETGFLVPTYWADCDEDLALRAPLLAREWLDHLALGQSVVVDVQALEQALRTLITQPDLRRRMGTAARQRAVTEYAWPVVIARLEALWLELAAAAQHDSQGPQPTPTYADPPYFRAFSHYPTRLLDSATRVALSMLGAEVLDGEATLPRSRSAELLEEAVAEEALRSLAGSEGALALGQLEQSLVRSRSLHPAAARRHILWLLKQGLIDLAC